MASNCEQEISYTPELYKSRWFMLFLFCLLTLANGAQWSNFATISDIVQSYYHVDSFAVNSLAMIYFVVYGVFVFFSTWVLDRYGLKKNLLVGAVLNAAGAIIKCAGINRSGYILLMSGQTAAAFGQCFTLGIPAHLAAVWFGENERAVITSVGVFANQVGVAVGFSLSPILVPSTPAEETGKGLFVLFVSQAVFSASIALLLIVFFKEKPPTPPTFSQINQYSSTEVQKFDGFFITIWELMRNPSYVLLAIAYGLYVSISYTFATVLNDLIQPLYPGENTFTGSLAFVYIISGLPGAILAGIWLEKTKAYKCAMLTASISTTLIYAIFTVVLQRFKSHMLLFVVVGFLGFTGTAVFPVGFEFAAELTYPVKEGVSSGLINCCAQVLGIVFVALGTYLLSLDNIGIDVTNWTFTAVLALSAILLCFVKPETKRSTADRYKTVVNMD